MLKLGTAKITTRNGELTLEYMNHGSFLVGRQTAGHHDAGLAYLLKFCRDRGLRIISNEA